MVRLRASRTLTARCRQQTAAPIQRGLADNVGPARGAALASALARPCNVAPFHRAGIRMLVGTDTPQPFVVPGASLHEGTASFVAVALQQTPLLGVC